MPVSNPIKQEKEGKITRCHWNWSWKIWNWNTCLSWLPSKYCLSIHWGSNFTLLNLNFRSWKTKYFSQMHFRANILAPWNVWMNWLSTKTPWVRCQHGLNPLLPTNWIWMTSMKVIGWNKIYIEHGKIGQRCRSGPFLRVLKVRTSEDGSFCTRLKLIMKIFRRIFNWENTNVFATNRPNLFQARK